MDSDLAAPSRLHSGVDSCLDDELLGTDSLQQDDKGALIIIFFVYVIKRFNCCQESEEKSISRGQCWELGQKPKVSGACSPSADVFQQCLLYPPTAETMANKNAEAQSVPSVKSLNIDN